MTFSFGINLSVKFRAFGITFGSYAKALAIGFDVAAKQFSFSPSASVPTSGLDTLINERGVLIQVWA